LSRPLVWHQSTAWVTTMQPQTIDLKQAKANPSRVFNDPQEVVARPDLTRETKIEILRQWETDARLLATAENENMAGGEGNRLGAVVKALIELGDERHSIKKPS